jgi:Transglycosylase SLT domain
MAPLGHPGSGANGRADFQTIPFAVERFEYAAADLLRLSLRVSVELPGPTHPMLLVEREAVEHTYPSLLAYTGRVPTNDAGDWMWRGAFAVPPELANDARALFVARLYDDLLFILPAPSGCVARLQEPSQRKAAGVVWPSAQRRRALAFVVTCQLCAALGWSSPGALADGSIGAGAAVEPAPETPPSPPAGGPTEPAPAPTPETPPAPPVGGPSEPAPVTPPSPSAGGTTTPSPPSTSTGSQASTPVPVSTPTPAASEAPTVVLQRRQKATTSKKISRNVTATRARPTTIAANASKGGVRSPRNNVALASQLVAAQVGALVAELAGSAASAQALTYYRIPLFLLPIYQAAAAQYRVPWQILAAINEVETDYGNDLSVSTAGAVGWMQFMPATWAQYGVDALNAGYADPYNPVDAIFAAARYLRAAGAQSNQRAAILAYNHSDEYVSSVLLRAKLISTYPQAVIATLTDLTDGRLPVSGRRVAWSSIAPVGSSSSATAHATAIASRGPAQPAGPGSSAPPSPRAVAAAASGTAGMGAQPLQRVDVMSSPNAAVVAVKDGRVVKLGSSRQLGKYLLLRDIYGDVFTYAGLGSTALSYFPPKVPRTTGGSRKALRLRSGSVVAAGTVLGRVRVPRGASDGHLRFAIQPAGDQSTVDPRPILQNWAQLDAALHPQGASDETGLIGATATGAFPPAPKRAPGLTSTARAASVAHSAGARRTSPSPPVVGGELSATQWDQLIARIAALRVPTIRVTPSSSAISDPKGS